MRNPGSLTVHSTKSTSSVEGPRLQMSGLLDSVYTENPSLGRHYELVLRARLVTLWRRKWLVMAIVAAALVLGVIVTLLMPKQYTAEAYIRGGFIVPDLVTGSLEKGGAAVVGLDASQLVETRSRVLQSHQLARQVLERLGLERLRPAVSGSLLSAWLQGTFYGDSPKVPNIKRTWRPHGCCAAYR